MSLTTDEDMWVEAIAGAISTWWDEEEATEEAKANPEKIDHRKLPRAERKKYNHSRALRCIQEDYLGPSSLFDDKQFWDTT